MLGWPLGWRTYRTSPEAALHLSVELEHKTYWAIKETNLNVDVSRINQRIQISELEELQLKAYHNTSIYKERMKRWYD
jgi:hypothetical protein